MSSRRASRSRRTKGSGGSRETRAAPARYIISRAAYYEPPPPPKVVRRQAKRLSYEAHMALDSRTADAERVAREAIERLVDAFLIDRHGNTDCFVEAHRLGRKIEQRYGCGMQLDHDGRHWSTQCGILALHQRLGSSPGGPTLGECSICGARDFECDHVPGERYDGARCVRIIVEWDVREISLVPFPNDPRCYRVFTAYPVAEVEQARGRPLLPGEVPLCTHCRDCYGHARAMAEDIDQGLWPIPAIGSDRG